MGDPRRGVGLDARGLPDIAWVEIPVPEGAEVTLETEGKDRFGVHPFRIARYPVTWAQYRAFLDAEDGYRDKKRWWKGLQRENEPGLLLWGFANYPAVDVSWYDAVAFCRWLTEKLGLGGQEVIRLPTEWEWQWAGQAGGEQREYPWNGAWHPARANSIEAGIGRTTAVGMYPLGAPQPWEVMDLAGNLWEWCLNEHDIPGNSGQRGEAARVLRGGSCNGSPGNCRAAGRYLDRPVNRDDSVGFRVCCGAPIE